MKINHLTALGHEANTESLEQHEMQVQMEIEPSIKKPQIYGDIAANQLENRHFRTEDSLNSEQVEDADDIEITEKDDFSETSMETELEKLALKFGRSKSDDDEQLLDYEAKNSLHLNPSFDLKISPQQKLQNFVDFKLVSIHPTIKSQLALRVESLKSEISTLKKMLKRF